MKWKKRKQSVGPCNAGEGSFSYIEVTVHLGPQTHQDENLL